MLIPLMVKYKALPMPVFIKRKIEDIKIALTKKFNDNDPMFQNIFEGLEFP